MKYDEIKEQMTQGKWTSFEPGEDKTSSTIPIIRGKRQQLIAHVLGQKTDARAIITAINSTYGKGINPEAVEMLVEALEKVKIMLGIKDDFAPLGTALALAPTIQQALAMAKGELRND